MENKETAQGIKTSSCRKPRWRPLEAPTHPQIASPEAAAPKDQGVREQQP